MEENGLDFPRPEVTGEGVVTPGKPKRSPEERHAYHKALFLERGISEAEAHRLADAVLARDNAVVHPPLELSPEEAARLAGT